MVSAGGGKIEIDYLKWERLRAFRFRLEGESGNMARNQDVVRDVKVFVERVMDKGDGAGGGRGQVVVVINVVTGGVGRKSPIILAVKMCFLEACDVVIVGDM